MGAAVAIGALAVMLGVPQQVTVATQGLQVRRIVMFRRMVQVGHASTTRVRLWLILLRFHGHPMNEGKALEAFSEHERQVTPATGGQSAGTLPGGGGGTVESVVSRLGVAGGPPPGSGGRCRNPLPSLRRHLDAQAVINWLAPGVSSHSSY